MRSPGSEIGHRFWEHPDLVVKPHKTGEASLLRAPIGRQLFHSRPYGALFDLDDANDKTRASDPKTENRLWDRSDRSIMRYRVGPNLV
jgi:hypothetical protein